MDKKTKLYLGIGVVAVGAYLLMKSKKATTPVVAAAPASAKFVGANGGLNTVGDRMISADSTRFASVGPNQKFNADGKFASVGQRQISADGGKFASVGQRQISADGGMINSLDVMGAHAGSQNAGIFANKPFVGNVANMVGATGEKVFANQSGMTKVGSKTSGGKTVTVYTQDLGGTFGPVSDTTKKARLVGADGGFFAVHDGFGY